MKELQILIYTVVNAFLICQTLQSLKKERLDKTSYKKICNE